MAASGFRNADEQNGHISLRVSQPYGDTVCLLKMQWLSFAAV
jgi:hypothetical protein